MEIEQVIISAAVTIFSVGLLIVSFLSYRRYKTMKLLVVCVVFFIFLLKGIFLSFRLFFHDVILNDCCIYGGVFDLIILLLLFTATLKR